MIMTTATHINELKKLKDEFMEIIEKQDKEYSVLMKDHIDLIKKNKGNLAEISRLKENNQRLSDHLKEVRKDKDELFNGLLKKYAELEEDANTLIEVISKASNYLTLSGPGLNILKSLGSDYYAIYNSLMRGEVKDVDGLQSILRPEVISRNEVSHVVELGND